MMSVFCCPAVKYNGLTGPARTAADSSSGSKTGTTGKMILPLAVNATDGILFFKLKTMNSSVRRTYEVVQSISA